MALNIVDSCVNCWACLPLCPNKAISDALPHFTIDAGKCNECVGEFADPQCAAICPVEGAIIDQFGEALNPAGSLTGISPERMQAAKAEIRAR